MGLRKLATGVSEEVYDRYMALLPEGVSVNAHLGALVEAAIAGNYTLTVTPGPPITELMQRPPVHVLPDVYNPDQPIAEQLAKGYVRGVDANVARSLGLSDHPDAPIDAQIPDPPGPLTQLDDPISREAVAEAAANQNAARAIDTNGGEILLEKRDTLTIDPDACFHPHGAQVREGRLTRCTLCDKVR